MEVLEFKKVGRLLKEVYKQLEEEAISDGIDIFSAEFVQVRDALRLEILRRMGFTLEEYRATKELVAPAKKTDVTSKLEEVTTQISNTEKQIAELEIPDADELLEKAREIAEAVVKAPVIQNNIVERTTKVVEKPTIVKETVTNVINEEFDANPIYAELGYLNDRLDNLPEPELFNPEPLRNEFKKDLDVVQEVIRGMPDFRKLGMGLQQQVDTKIEGVNVTRIIYSATQPTDQPVGTIWISPA